MAVRIISKRNFRRSLRGNLASACVLSLSIIGAVLLLTRQSAKVEAAVTQAPIVAEFDSIALPVPVEYVPSGTRLRDIKFRNVSFPKHQVPEGALHDLRGVLDSVAVAPLPANLPLFRANLSSTPQKNPVVERIPPGMRAMTIKVDATSAVEGWAGSGSIVDVLLVTKDRTSVIAEKVKILSAERSVSPVEGGSAPNVPSTVTLLVTQDQCLAINTAIPLGKIAFALRSIKDEEGWQATIYTPEKLKGGAVRSDTRDAINGFVAIQSGKSKKSFALSNGKWIRTDVIPEGFMPAQDNRLQSDTVTKR